MIDAEGRILGNHRSFFVSRRIPLTKHNIIRVAFIHPSRACARHDCPASVVTAPFESPAAEVAVSRQWAANLTQMSSFVLTLADMFVVIPHGHERFSHDFNPARNTLRAFSTASSTVGRDKSTEIHLTPMKMWIWERKRHKPNSRCPSWEFPILSFPMDSQPCQP